jgi:hypothetical protein
MTGALSDSFRYRAKNHRKIESGLRRENQKQSNRINQIFFLKNKYLLANSLFLIPWIR